MNLSPNGLALQEGGMLSMTELDGIKGIDKEKNTITVQAGARVSQILAELQKHNLTLENFSSITETQKSPGQLHAGTELEQQIAGWTQVSAHGTGARIPPVDEMITSMTVVSPAKGLMTLREGDSWFPWMRVALGSLAVVQEMTLKVRPRYMLHERTYCCNYAELERDHAKLLQTYRHVRHVWLGCIHRWTGFLANFAPEYTASGYMWVPYTDTIVVVVSDIAKPGAKAVPALPEERRVEPLKRLLREMQPETWRRVLEDCGSLEGKNFAELREKLLVLDPLNPDHVAKVNRAEAEFWRKSSGERIADSTEVLGFECGGSQWVLENCFPCGTIDSPNLKDIKYVQEMKGIIERERIAAASPIEQRWTSRSSSPMSPAYSKEANALFSWVGVIMYITSEDQAPAIKEKFREFAMRHADLTFKYDGFFHWGKVDLAFHKGDRRKTLQENIAKKFDVKEFAGLKKELDPHNVLGNDITDAVLWG
ncbi:unnamed protein product [Durusdinium trenchii]|uniref:FAD-binding PCMH-type domain-containing protein n=1 Tax=Durusdinium trenchii TaxID=1381693 RepID=A0ABP0LWE9_9DINO